MNNRERQMWIDNDEGLYSWWKSEHCSMSAFIREHREELDGYINRELNKEPTS